jgi:DNA-binding transcriptional ArsR family regulator
MSTVEPATKLATTDDNVLKILAEDYVVNPGLHMTREDLQERLTDVAEEKVDQTLKSLESEGLVKLYRDGRGAIALAKASYTGLRKAGPLQKYNWYPNWVSRDFIF